MFKPSCGSTKILYQVFTSYVKIWDHVNLIQLNVRLKSFMFHSYLLSLNLKLLTLLQLRGGGPRMTLKKFPDVQHIFCVKLAQIRNFSI